VEIGGTVREPGTAVCDRSELIATGIAGIDLVTITLVSGQKMPYFA
jgi:Archaeal/vacuolar-type H+-ATPase subunit B